MALALRSRTPVLSESSEDTVRLVSVSKSYGRRHCFKALQDVTTSFPHGTLTAVMGLSGCGKSTLLQCAAGLDRPSAGKVYIGGTDITRLSKKKLSVFRRERVGFVFQALNLVPTLSVAENIVLPLRLDRHHVDHMLMRETASQVGIVPGQLRRLPDTLSGGQRQRVAVARALIANPDVIFADEPTAALDPYITDAVLGLLRHAVDDLHQTVVLVTHAPTVAAWADRVLIMDHGQLIDEKESPNASTLTEELHRLGEAKAVAP
jgi:putative ABC transport system ATP-binding protein